MQQKEALFLKKYKLKKMAFKTLKYEFVEIVVPAGSNSTRYNFPDLPKLRYTSLQAVETFSGVIPDDKTLNNGDLTLTPLNNAVFPISTLKYSYLVLYLNERQDVYRVPLISLHRTQSNGSDAVGSNSFIRSLFEFAGQKVTWDKSYVELAIAPTFIGAGANSFAFGIYYA